MPERTAGGVPPASSPVPAPAQPVLLPTRIVGLDLGQSSDPTAMAVLETDWRGWDFQIRHLERFELNRPWPEYIDRVWDYMHTPALKGATLVIDHTGVGRVVMDMFRAKGMNPRGITITAGDKWSHGRGATEFRVPKRDIAMAGLALLQGKRLKIARSIAESGVLIHEMLNFRIKITTSGNDTYEAWRAGDHDDLVLAVCCAAWYAINGRNVKVAPSVGGEIAFLQALQGNSHANPLAALDPTIRPLPGLPRP
jgi:hypothetical protein